MKKIKLSTKQLNLLKEKITDLSNAETENALGIIHLQPQKNHALVAKVAMDLA
jgi:hypothetical protein